MNNGKICIPVCSETAAGLVAEINRAAELADIVEVRFDCLSPSELAVAVSTISGIKFGKPLIATFRSPNEGGHSSASLAERVEFWRDLPDGYEHRDFESDIAEMSSEQPDGIVSFHDFDSVPENILSVYENLSSLGDIVKLAVRVDEAADAIPLWKLIERANTDGRKIIPVAMGDAGKWTRILGLAHGAYLTYASAETGSETAPGQITAKDMLSIYRAKELDSETAVFAVLGDPIAQSLSPYMHNPAFVASGMNAVFLPLLIKDIGNFFRRMVKAESREVELNFGGFSVTMPHKQSIMPFLDAIEPTAAAIGAVNTVNFDNGKLRGFNTDALGFITPLKAKFGDLQGTRVAVFGAGGAARAVVYALKQENAEVTVYARDGQKAKALADEFGVNSASISTIGNNSLRLADDHDIVVNATPLGMKGPQENETLFTSDQLAGVKFVYDLVTKATDTPIIREAKLAGVPTLGGIEMLIAQGMRQFEIWTGNAAPEETMRSAAFARFEYLRK
jgi:3-dehydroquinate dehydratase/shikimate dehydrogenase